MRSVDICKRPYYRKKFGWDNIFDQFCFAGNCFNLGPISIEFYGFKFCKEI